MAATTSDPTITGRFRAWLLGTQPEQQGSVGDLLLTLPIYLIALALLWGGANWGLVSLTRVLAQTLYSLTGFALLYAWARRPWQAGAQPPPVEAAHLMFSCTSIALAYALFDVGRLLAMPLLCVVLVFDLRKFTPHQIRDAALLALALMIGSVPLRSWLVPGDVNMHAEMLSLAGAALLLPVVALVVRRVKGMQTQLGTQRLELADKLKQLQELATHDALTGLYNRRHMNALLEEEFKRQARRPRAFCIAMLDIDLFKRINDSHGHAVGDAVLRDFAGLVLAAQGPVDAVARWGGEEFVLLMPGAEPGQAMALLERLRQALAAHDWARHAQGLAVTYSAGVAAVRAGETVQAMLDRADRALYQAKEQGRNCGVLG